MPNYLSLSRPTRKTVRKMKNDELRGKAELFKKLEDLGIQFAKEARDSKRELKELDKFCQGNNQGKILCKKVDLFKKILPHIEKLGKLFSSIQETYTNLPKNVNDLNNLLLSIEDKDAEIVDDT